MALRLLDIVPLYNRIKQKRYSANIWAILYLIEQMSLVILSVASSAKDFETHRNSFVVFIISPVIGNWVGYYLEHHRVLTGLQQLRWRLMLLNTCSIAIGLTVFVISNAVCQAYLYSLFSFFEYVFVFSNIALHGTTTLEFVHLDVRFCIDSSAVQTRHLDLETLELDNLDLEQQQLL